MNILYGLCSWGFGHATRSLPIIRKLVKEGHEMTIVTTGGPLYMLKDELGDSVDFHDLPDYPLPYTEKRSAFMFKFMTFIPSMLRVIEDENAWVLKMHEKKKFDRIISDNRYGIYHKSIPSYLITHQLRLLTPGRIRFLEKVTEKFVSYFQRRFECFLVPDFEEEGLSGELAHDLKYYDLDKVAYIGVLSDFDPVDVETDIDIYVSISGPEPQRTLYEEVVRSQIHDLKGRVVVSLGTKRGKVEELDNIKIIPYLTKEERIDVLNKAKLIVSRSGYTTLMDLCLLGKKALFSPTPGQPEQEYLSQYHNKLKTWYSVDQEDIDFDRDLKKANEFSGMHRGSTEEAVQKTLEIVL
jgi:uncharacterized protein (TIGR00661 family)